MEVMRSSRSLRRQPAGPVLRRTLTACEDVVGALLLASLLPVWMAVGLIAAAVIMIRHLYWWARGNTTETSRSPVQAQSSPRHDAAPGRDDFTAGTSPSTARTPLAAVHIASPAVPGASAR